MAGNRNKKRGLPRCLDAACASSLAALEAAIQTLVANTSEMVLVGGADLHNSINDYLMFSSVQALSRTGNCRSFDSKADGITLGEGIGVVVFGIAFLVMVKMAPFSVQKEIEEDQNTALGIVMGSVIIGLAIIIAAAMGG